MGSPRLKLNQVRDAFRLIGELRDVGNDPERWREHMVRRLMSLIGARFGTSAELPMPLDWRIKATQRAGFVACGFSDVDQRDRWLASGGSSEREYNPLAPEVARIKHRSFTHSRQQLVSDQDWYGSEWVNRYPREIGMDDSLMSHQVLPGLNCIHSIWLHREWGDRLFTPVDVRLLHLFHNELARLWRQNRPTVAVGTVMASANSLSPRLRHTLEGLLQGDSEKQIAIRLGLSRHTVHKYIGMLHRKFDVCSNGELLARCLNSGMPTYPRLASQVMPPFNRGR